MPLRKPSFDNDGPARTVPDPQEGAEKAGLRYVSDNDPGIKRRKRGKGFRYILPDGDPVTDPGTLERIRKLAIPPAYTDVWICLRASGHIQATGRDAKRRKQYRYHSRFREERDSTKYAHMLEFAAALPAIRAHVDADMRRRGLPREKVLATIVHLLESTMIRVGNPGYAKRNQSYGLTTLKNRHVAIDGAELRFRFKGKSGKLWKLDIRNRRVARIVREAQDLPGQHLFQYLDEAGMQREVTSDDVNSYLKEISGTEITAKDFRTWNGTVLAAIALSEYEMFDNEAAAKRNIRAAVETVAARLGNTATICRKCYIHPEVFESYLGRALRLDAFKSVGNGAGHDPARLRPEESVVLAFLQRRLSRKRPLPAVS